MLRRFWEAKFGFGIYFRIRKGRIADGENIYPQTQVIRHITMI